MYSDPWNKLRMALQKRNDSPPCRGCRPVDLADSAAIGDGLSHMLAGHPGEFDRLATPLVGAARDAMFRMPWRYGGECRSVEMRFGKWELVCVQMLSPHCRVKLHGAHVGIVRSSSYLAAPCGARWSVDYGQLARVS
jgi:hypothetical protein